MESHPGGKTTLQVNGDFDVEKATRVVLEHYPAGNRAVSRQVLNVTNTGGEPTINVGGVSDMRDIYNVDKAGAVGPYSKASHITFQEIWQQSQGTLDLTALAGELATLRRAMRKEAETPAQDRAVAEVG